jgi:hypothetical protein
MARRDVRRHSGSGSGSGNLPKVGGEDQVVNVSGAPSANTERRPRDHAIAPPPPGRALPHRRPVEIDAQSGQALGEKAEKATAYAANKASIRKTVDQADPMGQREEECLRHVLGVPRA